MNMLSILVGALVAAVIIFSTDQVLTQQGGGFIAMSWMGIPLFLAIAIVSAWAGRVLILIMLVTAFRPRTAMSWSRPSQCPSTRDWCASSWDIRTLHSRQTGHRVFGLNLSLCGGMPALNTVATPDRTTSSL